MPGTARRLRCAAAVSIAIFALFGAQAFGGLTDGASTPQLQSTAGLGGAEVSTPPVPEVSVPSTPSVPTAPSAPSGSTVADGVSGAVQKPSTPTASAAPAAAAPSAGRQAAGTSGSAQTRPAPAGGGSAAGNAGSASLASSGGSAARNAAQRKQRRAAHERRLRTAVERYSGCLGRLDGLEGRLLVLRAGVLAAPISRHAAAERLGVSLRRARTLERGGLRHLRQAGRSGACGSSGGAHRDAAALLAGGGAGVPRLQPVALLTRSRAPSGRAAGRAALGRDVARQGVKGARG
ncbi:MAG TPA: hypothetical protein VF545_02120, partial [Thermoleophilaceae bacterium]